MKKAILAMISAIFFAAAMAAATAVTAYALPEIRIKTPESPFAYRNEWQYGYFSLENSAHELQNFRTYVRVRGRGNSTWWMGENKRPLRLRFGSPRPMFGSDYVATDWILLADNFDRSLLRNYSALFLSRELGTMDFVPMAQHVHLYVNDEYMGVYLFTDERDIGRGRIDIRHRDDPARSGFFFELDGRAHVGGIENETFVRVNGMLYDIRFPSGRRRTAAHVDYLRDYIYETSRAIRGGNFNEIVRLIDIDTFVDFYIVQEFFKNQDAYGFSVFMHISGEGDARRLYKGPVWDFDLIAGNSATQWLGYGADGLYVAIFNYWYRHLMEVPEFFDAVAVRWGQLRRPNGEIERTIQQIRRTAIANRRDFERNHERHPVAPHFLRPEFRENPHHEWHAEYLASWLEARAAWLDGFFAGNFPDYCHMWELVEYYKYERPVHVTINGALHAFEIPPIRLPYTVMITTREAERLFGTEIHHEIHHNEATIIREHSFIPLRTIAQTLGYTVEWHEAEHTVSLEYINNQTQPAQNVFKQTHREYIAH
ncbi:MAG: CotH kinase family protein [Defluviitaleaceae bacterium]|nr:CotH kinase family protein [Defluviitaleaceae bacterium]